MDMKQQDISAYIADLNVSNEKIISENKYLKEKQQELKRQLLFQKKKLDGMVQLRVECAHLHEEQLYLGLSGGMVQACEQSYVINQDIGIEVDVHCLVGVKHWLFIGLSNGQIAQFHGEQRQKIFFKQNIQSAVTHLINYKNKYVIATYEQGKTIVWDLALVQAIYESQDGESPCTSICYGFQFGDFIIFGDTEGTIKFTYFNEQKNKATFDVIKRMKNGDSSVVALSHLANYQEILLASLSDKSICVWNWETVALLTIIKLELQCVGLLSAFLNETRFAIALLEGGVAQLYHFDINRTAKFISQVQLADQNTILGISTGEFGTFQVIGSQRQTIIQVQEEPLAMVQLTNVRIYLQGTISHHTSCVYALTMIEYPFFASSSDDRLIKIFNVQTHDVIQTLKGHQAYVRALGLLQDRKHLISGSYDSSVKIWEIQTGICQNTLTGHTKPVLAVQVIPHSEFACVSGGEDAVIKGWNWKQAICLWMIEMGKNEVWSLQSVRDLSTSTYGILSGHKDGMVSLINVGYKFSQFVLERELKVHKSFVNYILNVKDQVVATASSDNLIVLLNWKQMSVVRVLKGHHDIVWNVERVDDHTLISSSTEGNIKLWNWKSGVCLNTAYGTKGSIYTLLKIPHSKKILSGTATGDIHTWRMITPHSNTLSNLIR